MSKMEFKTHVKEHYIAKELPAASMDRLLELTEMVDAGEQIPEWSGSTTKRFRPGVAMLVAALFVSVVAAGFYLYHINMKAVSVEELRYSIAAEVAKGHNKNKPVEFETDNYGDVHTHLARLDFVPTAPAMLAEKELRLKGGRYCSLGGNIAAQLKIENKKGVVCTLYMAKLNEEMRALGDYVLHFQELEVKVWHEGDIVYGLAVPLSGANTQLSYLAAF